MDNLYRHPDGDYCTLDNNRMVLIEVVSPMRHYAHSYTHVICDTIHSTPAYLQKNNWICVNGIWYPPMPTGSTTGINE